MVMTVCIQQQFTAYTLSPFRFRAIRSLLLDSASSYVGIIRPYSAVPSPRYRVQPGPWFMHYPSDAPRSVSAHSTATCTPY